MLETKNRRQMKIGGLISRNDFLVKIVIIKIALILPLSAFAKDYHLDEMVITTSKNPRKLKDVPVQTTVISGEELEKTHANKLKDALVYVPGLQLRQIHGKTGFGVWMQGFNSNQVLILLDGVPITPNSGTTIDVSQIAIGDIERIEIIKGAAPTLYGTAAMGGVINVISKKPTKKIQLKANVQGGSWGDQNTNGSLLGKHNTTLYTAINQEKWYAQIHTDWLESQGFDATPEDKDTQGWAGYKRNFSAKVGWRVSGVEIALIPRYFKENTYTVRDKGRDSPGVVGLANYIDQGERKQLGTVAEKKGDTVSWKVRLEAEDYETKSIKAARRNTQANRRTGGARVSLPLGEDHVLTYGMQFHHDFLNSENLSLSNHNKNEVDGKTKREYHFFLQDSWFVTDDFELLPGLRFNRNDRNGSHFAPSINSIYKLSPWQGGMLNIRAGVTNGYRTPSLKELFFKFDHSQIGYMVLGNTDLKPERSVSYQLGFEWIRKNQRFFEEVVRFNLFYNDIDHLIDYFYTGKDNRDIDLYTYQNIARAETKGWGLDIIAQPLPYLYFGFGFNYLDARDLKTGKTLSKRPMYDVKFNLNIALSSRIDWAIKTRYQSESLVDASAYSTYDERLNKKRPQSPAFTVIDTKINHTLTEQWRLYYGINNVTAEQRSFKGPDLRPIESRFIYFGLAWQYEVD